MSPILALDIGTVRIGVAISNPEHTIALGYGTIHVRQCQNPIDEIVDIIQRENIQKLVAGWPLELDGTEGPATRRTKQLLAKLKQKCPQIRIIPQDERLTSSAAENALQEMETRGSDKKNLVDTMAAILILQMYLDSHPPKHHTSTSSHGGSSC
ncbi:MAG: Holliday junction resolvase RuvX [Proteobacteria bacterium]|nr:Holliday junction resolvase RuvX [Pseudomonadota bacterium]